MRVTAQGCPAAIVTKGTLSTAPGSIVQVTEATDRATSASTPKYMHRDVVKAIAKGAGGSHPKRGAATVHLSY